MILIIIMIIIIIVVVVALRVRQRVVVTEVYSRVRYTCVGPELGPHAAGMPPATSTFGHKKLSAAQRAPPDA
jgi:hypothetical protein